MLVAQRWRCATIQFVLRDTCHIRKDCARRALAWAACLIAILILSPAVQGQQPQPAPLRVSGVNPSGVSIVATESLQTYDFSMSNRTDQDRTGRLVMFFVGRPEAKYGREIWVPARSTMNTWMLVGPASPAPGRTSAEIETQLFERFDGKDRLLLPPTDEKIRSRDLLFRKREFVTAVMIDEEPSDEIIFGRMPGPETPADEAVYLARTFRLAHAALSERLSIVQSGPLPPTPEALDLVEHFVLASSRIADDPVGLQSLRNWLARGGKLWIMLDRVTPEIVSALLGDAVDFQIVDRIRATTIKIDAPFRGEESPPQQHERPIEFVRVLLPNQEQAAHTMNGWPVWFTRSVGRGTAIFTTLGPRGWYRPRKSADPPARFDSFPNTPVPLPHLARLAEKIHPGLEQHPFRLEEFQPMLTEEIGYAVVSRARVLIVFGGFVAAAFGVGLLLRKGRRPELLGWLGPIAAVGAAVTFFVVGEWSRRSAAATVAVAQVIDAVAGHEEAAALGLLAVYRPNEGATSMGAQRGGFFDLDMEGIDQRRLITTDLDAWHWEDLNLPAGIRRAPFHTVMPLKDNLRASARFGPQGIEGQCITGPFQNVADALLTTPGGRNLAVRLSPDGTFSIQSADVLPAQQFLAGAVLTDQQQRRQELYRAFLKGRSADKGQTRPMLLAWASPADLHFALAPEARTAGSALLVLPLQWAPTPAGERVHIPGPLITYQRVLDDVLARLTFEASQPAEMRIRFQIPASVLPLKLERVRLLAKIDAPNREVKVAGLTDGRLTEVYRVASPLDPLRIDIADARLLQLDAGGGLHLHVSISDELRKEGANKGAAARSEQWTIEYLELEVDGIRQ